MKGGGATGFALNGQRPAEKRKEAAGDDGQLFDISEKQLLDHVHSFDGGGFKTKDFRTLLGTRLAQELVAKAKKPTSEATYKKTVREVAMAVARQLGNTPAVALASYINPAIFAPLKIAA